MLTWLLTFINEFSEQSFIKKSCFSNYCFFAPPFRLWSDSLPLVLTTFLCFGLIIRVLDFRNRMTKELAHRMNSSVSKIPKRAFTLIWLFLYLGLILSILMWFCPVIGKFPQRVFFRTLSIPIFPLFLNHKISFCRVYK